MEACIYHEMLCTKDMPAEPIHTDAARRFVWFTNLSLQLLLGLLLGSISRRNEILFMYIVYTTFASSQHSSNQFLLMQCN